MRRGCGNRPVLCYHRPVLCFSVDILKKEGYSELIKEKLVLSEKHCDLYNTKKKNSEQNLSGLQLVCSHDTYVTYPLKRLAIYLDIRNPNYCLIALH